MGRGLSEPQKTAILLIGARELEGNHLRAQPGVLLAVDRDPDEWGAWVGIAKGTPSQYASWSRTLRRLIDRRLIAYGQFLGWRRLTPAGWKLFWRLASPEFLAEHVDPKWIEHHA
jgi:hypothetical protein